MIVNSPMPAKVILVRVKVGDRLVEGDELVVIESMKMEIPVSAPVGGVIEQLFVQVGQAVEAGTQLVEINQQ